METESVKKGSRRERRLIVFFPFFIFVPKLPTAALGEGRETMSHGLLSYTTLYNRKQTFK